MPKFYFIVLVLVFAGTPLLSQNPYIKTSLFYETDKYELTPEQLSILDNLVFDLNGKEIQKVIIRGNTDADADSIYNINLSNKRAGAVADYLNKNGLDKSKFIIDHYGENKPKASNTNEIGKQQNRRVDIIVMYKIPISQTQVDVVVVEDTIISTTNSDCKKDTIIYLAGGSQIKMNACEYRDKKDCLEFTEYITAESIQAAGLTTYDDDGNELFSGGMFKLETCDSSCVEKPVIVRLPVPCNLSMSMQLFTLGEDGSWTDPQNQVRVISLNGNLFYEFAIECDDQLNVDKRVFVKNVDRRIKRSKLQNLLAKKTKFKAEKGMVFTQVSIEFACPIGQYNAQIKRKGKKAVFTDFGCLTQEMKVRVAAKSNNEEIVTGYKALHMYQNIKYRNKCGTNPKKVKISTLDFTPKVIEQNIRM